MTALVYHHTDTARLPWIVAAGELRPGRNKIGGFPDPDFLWATTSPNGDRTASASVDKLRSGLVRRVRFTLAAADFVDWQSAVAACPDWTPEHVTRLEALARGKSSPQDWRCRLSPLSSDRWLAVETNSYTNRSWIPFDWRAPLSFSKGGLALGVKLGDETYYSEHFFGPKGADAYHVTLGSRAVFA